MPDGFEKHAQTAIQIIIVSMTLYVGSAVLSLRDAVIRLEEKGTQTREGIVDLKSEIAGIRSQMAKNDEKNNDVVQRLRDAETELQRIQRVKRRGE